MKWNDKLIESELIASMKILNVDRMPTANELKSIGRNDLHCILSRTKKYSGWAAHMGIALKRSETVVGQEAESKMADFLMRSNNFSEIERMSTRHPYDLLIDRVVKVEVKYARSYYSNGYKTITFNLSKDKPTCDIYILIAHDSDSGKEKVYVIPSHYVQMKMLNMGVKTKYEKYLNRFDYIVIYSEFLQSV